MIIRKAELKDLEKLTEIYNYEVVNGVATLDINPRSLDEQRQWLENHNVDNHPLIVAEENGEVVGYASLSTYRLKEAYKSTVELSVYVDHNYRNNHVGSQLLQSILEYARNDASIHLVVSVITSGNKASAALHNKFGFTFCGTIKEVGVKFGTYQDIDNYQLIV